ncbi:helix-turn-helix domain-containing protein [Nocardia sp. ET3-3]|uniref:Helix-turn-helix domain-containing protein n=1 Tax=Nocardia terrae TaxID=2675851 RepID=A0A7K1UQ82_9NOCA|nr:AraC family transcriptional regulator [Nocardia terrae]MVU76505.1 helix-turn-helix domain-containing protein [Nocardia terrae]
MTAPPGKPADRPATQGDSLDLLSELLRSVRLSGEGVAEHAVRSELALDFAGTGRLHLLEDGELEFRIDGRCDVVRAGAGDMVLLPRGDAHRLTNVGPTPARWLCGAFAIGDPQADHLLGSLPAVVLLGRAGTPVPEGLTVARHMLQIEIHSPSQGSAVMISRILDLMFIQIMRTWAARENAEPNWLAGAFDPELSPSLTAIHRNPAHDWTVEELARACNLSRSAFAARFTTRVGTPPATYLSQVRLDTATTLLRTTTLPIPQIAERVGYTSEAAFGRAFKSRYDIPPARFRRTTHP